MPRKALPRKACGSRSTRKGYAASVGRRSRRRLRSEDFHTAEQWESNGISQAVKNVIFDSLRAAPRGGSQAGPSVYSSYLARYFRILSANSSPLVGGV